MKKFALALALGWAGMAAAASPTSVVGSSHDLSSAGKDVQAPAGQAQDQVCVYCHMPHNASNVGAPLWNRTNTATTFQMYSKDNSATFVLNSGDTNAANRTVGPVSLACLSCHDGATAFNSLNQGPMIDLDNNIKPAAYTFSAANMAAATPPGSGSADLGQDLTNDHPISFTYDSALATLKGSTLRDPGAHTSDGSVANSLVIFRAGGVSGGAADTIAAQMLFTLPPTATSAAVTNQLECASCHEPHMQGNLADPTSNYPFLIKSNQKSNLCLTCHNK
jgi:predicted CXXCH cytochrome family protein